MVRNFLNIGPYATLVLALVCLTSSVQAESQLSFFGGAQVGAALASGVSAPAGFTTSGIETTGDLVSNNWPSVFGLRYTNWKNEKFGYGIELDHSTSQDSFLSASNSSTTSLDFSNGLSTLTVSAIRRYPQESSGLTPYLGAGIGISVPKVRISSSSTTTSKYQVTGAAIQLIAGATYTLSDRWSIFGEYKGAYSENSAQLPGGGRVYTNVFANTLNVGLSLGF